MCAMKFPNARLPSSFDEFVKYVVSGSSSGIGILKDITNKTISFTVKFSNKNLKINGDGEIDTVQDVNITSSPEFSGLKIGNQTGLLGRTDGVLENVSLGEGLSLENNVLNVSSVASAGNFVKIITPVSLNTGDVVYKDTFPDYIGFSSGEYIEGEEATVLTSGEITLTDTLVPNSYYYIDNSNNKKITNEVPVSGWLIRVGIALDEHTLLIQPILKIKRA